MRLLALSMGVVALGGCTSRTAPPVPVVATAPPPLITRTAPPLRKPPASVKRLDDNGVAVLTWHRIAAGPDDYTVTTPEKFATQLAFLKQQKATVLRLEDAVRMVKTGKPLPPRAVALGFDDGFKSCYTRVFPLLKKYKWPATLYVYPDYISGGGDSLSWKELREMQRSGLVDVQSHSMGHPNLVLMGAKGGWSYAQRLQHEVADSKRVIEEKLGKPVTQLAFPFGFYNEAVLKEAQKAGYKSTWTVNAAPFRSKFAVGETWMSLPRYLVFRGDSMATFARYAFSLPLKVAQVWPPPNVSGSNRLPVISAKLGEEVDPRSVQMRLAIIQKVDVHCDAKTRVVSYKPRRALRKGVWTVSVSAIDKRGRAKAAAWSFMVK